jgi:predicted RNA binding protein YcfA (HicA-like mRNA interferase family)
MSFLSGADCVKALERSGFQVRGRTGGITTLARSGRLVVVPEVPGVTPALLSSILRSAGLSLTQLHGALCPPPGQPVLDDVPPRAPSVVATRHAPSRRVTGD